MKDGYGEEAQEIEKKEVTEVVAEKSEDNKQEDKKTEDNKTEDNKPEIKPEGEKSAEEKVFLISFILLIISLCFSLRMHQWRMMMLLKS